MIAKYIITDEILPLKTSDECSFALFVMEENRVHHLPVVNNRELLGVVSEFDIVNHTDPEDPIGNVKLSLHNAFISENQHVFDAMKIITEMKLSLLPVVDYKGDYLGIITLPGLLSYVSNNTSLLNPGGIIVLKMSETNYSLSSIAQVVESNDARILCSYVTSYRDSTEIEVTLKISRIDIAAIIQTFNRFNYDIKATFAEKDDIDDLRERYDSFMNYLNI